MTSSDSVQAAAARLVKYHDHYDHVYWDDNKVPFDPDADGVAVARAYLELVREDDGEALDMDFVSQSGLPESGNQRWTRVFWLCKGVVIVARACEGPQCWQWSLEITDSDDEREVTDNPTRGQLRLLCRALSIPLAESPSQEKP